MFLINNPATKKLAGMISKYEKFSNNDKKKAAKWKEKKPAAPMTRCGFATNAVMLPRNGKPFVRTATPLARAIGGCMSKKAENEPVVEIQAADDDDE